MKALSIVVLVVVAILIYAMVHGIDSHAISVIRVPEDAATISAAVRLVSPGGEVRVAPGNYTEDLTIEKPLSIIGSGSSDTVLNGVHGVEPVRSVILIENPSASTIMKVEISGIQLTVEDDQSISGAIAIQTQGNVNFELHDCMLKAPSGIIDFSGNSSIVVDNCTFDVLDTAIATFNLNKDSAKTLVISHSDFDTYKSKRGFEFRNPGVETALMGINVSNKHVQLKSNIFSNAIFAVFATNIQGEVTDNSFNGNDVGIFLGGGGDVIIKKNEFSSNYYYGVVLASSAECPSISSFPGMGTKPRSNFIGHVEISNNNFSANRQGQICPPQKEY
jgi:parallel beta-helix repeat protein